MLLFWQIRWIMQSWLRLVTRLLMVVAGVLAWIFVNLHNGAVQIAPHSSTGRIGISVHGGLEWV